MLLFEQAGDARMPVHLSIADDMREQLSAQDAEDSPGLQKSGRTLAEYDERWRATKAAALTIVEAETRARMNKTARLRTLRMKRAGSQATGCGHGGRSV
jgi:hypothetical protein